ncbi:HET-domain-containing protein [Lentinus tigrinus ALCF2SS1-7]|uniref:HET-domain-containing protein n=1 Tax=Lentinus tigrinus ALCF2SS1-6 TaxID=1328759 RepID=A0A5C2SSC5_9APHY|nr:HET-domain-containing protein [Lentinus tigrinus ALCF2SS1-6]RPD76455.1 HET-domain-containing protein [Lentinus tigrinus ALCF2SS1-7]
MWLLDTSSGSFLHVDRPHEHRFAILSHVWRSNGELSFQDLRALQLNAERKRPTISRILLRNKGLNDSVLSKASDKIRGCCALARRHGYRWVWIDSCCIDKTSSTELSEAINSMYGWYAAADICFAYLEDVDDDHDPRLKDSKFRRSRWFSRGWTLQELIAPAVVVFVSQTWRLIGTKADLGDLVEEITGVDRATLTHAISLDSVSVARRMSWASKRKTTREEDRAYSLMGIFGVNMPTIYGEGPNSFRRLQEEILKHIPDQTIFLWGPILYDDEVLYRNLSPDSSSDDSRYWQSRSLFAWSPDAFINSRNIASIALEKLECRIGIRSALSDYAVTSHGISTRLPIIPLHHGTGKTTYLAVLASEDAEGRLLALLLYPQREGSGRYYVGHYVGRPQSPPYVHYRAVAIRSADILRNIQVQDVCIPYRQSSLVPRSPIHLVSPPKFRCPCDVIIPGWVIARLREDGFSTTLAAGGEEEADLTLHITETTAPSECALVLGGRNETIRIHMGRCTCMGRFLCVSVAGSGTPVSKRAATASTGDTLVELGPALMSPPAKSKDVGRVLTESLDPRCPTGHVASWEKGGKDFAYGLRRLRMTFSAWHTRQDVYTLEVHLDCAEDDVSGL